MKELEAVVIFTKEQINKWASQDFKSIAIPVRLSIDDRFDVHTYTLDEERESQDDAQ